MHALEGGRERDLEKKSKSLTMSPPTPAGTYNDGMTAVPVIGYRNVYDYPDTRGEESRASAEYAQYGPRERLDKGGAGKALWLYRGSNVLKGRGRGGEGGRAEHAHGGGINGRGWTGRLLMLKRT